MTAARLNEQTKGVFIISATPFTEEGALDLESTDRLIEGYLELGVDGVTILGMMGESQKLDAEESRAFLRRVLARVAGRVPVVVGVSNPGTANLVGLAKDAMDAGAAGVMVAPIAGLKTGDRIHAYYADLIAALDDGTPLCYQDYPQATAVHLSVGTLNRMIDDFPSLVMLKHEDWPGLAKLTRLRRSAEAEGRRRISVLCGNGGLFLPLELARGADGAMTGFAYPEMLVGLCRRFFAGDRDGAEDIFDAYLPLVRLEQQPGIGLALRKEILRRRGLIASARTRAPGPALTPEDHAELDRLIARLERRLAELG